VQMPSLHALPGKLPAEAVSHLPLAAQWLLLPVPAAIPIPSRALTTSLALLLTHHSWRHATPPSAAPLVLVKTCPGKSQYLYHTSPPLTLMLAQLRHNRAGSQVLHNRFDPTTSPDCTFLHCSQLDRPPSHKYVDTIPHILVQCARHANSRQQLRLALAAAAPLHFSRTIPVDLDFYLGEFSRSVVSLVIPRLQLAFRSLKDFFYSLLRERGADSRLLPFFRLPAHNDAQ
jgi:hypothetical protein